MCVHILMDTDLKSRVKNVSCCWPQYPNSGVDGGQVAGLTDGLLRGVTLKNCKCGKLTLSEENGTKSRSQRE